MHALLLVTTLLLTAGSHPLEGDYLSEQEFLRISRQQDETLVLGIHSRELSMQQPRRLAHVKLAPSGEGQYSGKANMGFPDGPLTVIRTERGLLLTGDGAPREAVRVDLAQRQPSRFSSEGITALIRQQVLDSGARLKEVPHCRLDPIAASSSELSESKFAHLQQLLARSQVTLDPPRKQEGLLHDLYSLKGTLVLPELEWKVANQRVCTNVLYPRLKVLSPPTCGEWTTGEVATRSVARTLPFELELEVTRFPDRVAAPPRLEWKRLGEREQPLDPTSLCRELQADALQYSARLLRNQTQPAEAQ
jgi:hypothetical protein